MRILAMNSVNLEFQTEDGTRLRVTRRQDDLVLQLAQCRAVFDSHEAHVLASWIAAYIDTPGKGQKPDATTCPDSQKGP